MLMRQTCWEKQSGSLGVLFHELEDLKGVRRPALDARVDWTLAEQETQLWKICLEVVVVVASWFPSSSRMRTR